jgi:hypothetical protein
MRHLFFFDFLIAGSEDGSQSLNDSLCHFGPRAAISLFLYPS